MANYLFVVSMSFAIFCLFRWAFHILPQEQWQILAVVPQQKTPENQWQGINLTYYGFFVATAVTVAVGQLLVLLGSLGIPTAQALLFASTLLTVCIPASKILAKWVEKKDFTFTIGGASFVGIMLAPVILLGIKALWPTTSFPIASALSALVIAFALGEGIGRLGCISFGCCYGKPLASCSGWLQKWFHQHHFQFSGDTKKVSYEGKLESIPTLPIQGITATIYILAYVIGLLCFVNGWFLAGLLSVELMTQIWRAVSEYWRADYRGERTFSAYQIMALVGCGYLLMVASFLSSPETMTPNILQGLESIWTPGILIFFQILWVTLFLYMGRSKVTGSVMSFFVQRERV